MDGRHHDRHTHRRPPDTDAASSTIPHHQDPPHSNAAHPGTASRRSETAPPPEPMSNTPRQSVEGFSETDATVITHDPPIPPRPNVEYLHPRELGHALEGQRLDHFELVEFVGGGGMGAVFRAHDTLLDRTVAVKVLASGQAENEETRLRFRNEAQSAARLDHENIARVHFVGEDQGVHYIVFEYIEGVNIRDLVQENGPLTVEQALSYTLQIAEALSHAGQRDVVHRDIKPSNILVTEEGQAKLVDMGLARMQHLGDRDDLTATGVTLGTFDYISPEQARDPRNTDTRSDIYSLGCTLFFMLCGAPPFPDGTVLQKLLQHQEDVPPDLRSHRDDIGAEISDLVRTMLAKSPEDRFQSSAELIATLVAVADQAGIRLSRPATLAPLLVGAPTDSPIRRHLPWIVPAAILVFCVFLFDAVGRRNDRRTEQPERVEPPSARRTTNPTPIVPDLQIPQSWSTPRDDGIFESANAPSQTARADGSSSDSASPTLPAERIARNPRPPSATAFNPALNKRSPESGWGLDLGQQVAVLATASQPSGGVTAPALALASHRLYVHPNAETAPPPGVRTGGKPESKTPENKKPRDVQDVPLVVMAGGREHTFATLGEACRAAESGQVIELHYSGPLRNDGTEPVWEPPIALGKKHLTVRAGEGFHPLLRFRKARSDGLESPGMITITGGALRLVYLDLEIDLTASPDTPPAPRSFVAAERAESIIISGCRVTVRGGILSEAAASSAAKSPAFFSLENDRSHQEPVPRARPDDRDATRIRLDNCVLRGDAVLVRATTATPIDLAWSNGLFATSRHLVERTAADSLAGGRTAARIELTHVTAVLALGLVQTPMSLTQDFGRPLAITCRDSLIVGQPSTVLVDQPAAEQLDAEQEALIWRGERTYYHGIEVFWRLGSAANVPLQLGFNGWREYWALHPRGDEIHTARTTVHWKHQPADPAPMDSLRTKDYVIDDSEADLPELHAASDGGPVGMRFDLLPAFDVEPPQNDL